MRARHINPAATVNAVNSSAIEDGSGAMAMRPGSVPRGPGISVEIRVVTPRVSNPTESRSEMPAPVANESMLLQNPIKAG